MKMNKLTYSLALTWIQFILQDTAVSAELIPVRVSGTDQIQRLKSAGYEPQRLDHSTQMRVFLYTWLAMERMEMG